MEVRIIQTVTEGFTDSDLGVFMCVFNVCSPLVLSGIKQVIFCRSSKGENLKGIKGVESHVDPVDMAPLQLHHEFRLFDL